MSHRRRVPESIVQTDAGDVVGDLGLGQIHDIKADAGDGSSDDVARRARAVEVEMQILDLGAPIAPQPRLDAAAQRPAAQHIVHGDFASRVIDLAQRRLAHAGPRRAARDIDQVTFVGQAHPAARGREPIELMAQRKGADLAVEVEGTFEAAAAGIPLTGPLPVGSDAKHHMTQLPVVAELTAGHAAARQNMAHAW